LARHGPPEVPTGQTRSPWPPPALAPAEEAELPGTFGADRDRYRESVKVPWL
jgi:hypothetical protein